jgi:hypothetical protein
LIETIDRLGDSQQKTDAGLHSLIETIDRLGAKVDKLTGH